MYLLPLRVCRLYLLNYTHGGDFDFLLRWVVLWPFAHHLTSSHVYFAFHTGLLMWARGRCFHSFSSIIHNLSSSVCPQLVFFFLWAFSFPFQSHQLLHYIPSPPLCAPLILWYDLSALFLFMYVWLSTEHPVFFLQCALFPPFSSLPLHPLLAPCLCSLFLLSSSSLSLLSSCLCPQCLDSVQRVSLPAQTAVASPGAGSAMVTTIVPMVQTR